MIGWTVPPEAAGERLDRHVAARLDVPRNQVQHWIEAGLVRLNGRAAKPSAAVSSGDQVECAPPERKEERVLPEAGELRLLYEDAALVVIDKPAGLTVHPGAGRSTGTLAHRLLDRYPEMAGVGGPGRPGIVHRLDQGTSGVLVVARTAAAYARLARAFAAREVKKRYLGIAYGAPSPSAGMIEAPIGRHPQRRKEMTVRPGGRPSKTGYRTLAAKAGISLLEMDLATGRTHQIRVHLKHIGHPLLGDPVYGEARWKGLPRSVQAPLRDFPRPALHAWRLAFKHPDTGTSLTFEALVPGDFRELWQAVTGEALPTPRARGEI
ncbi:MAG TPA: RluA family pseudouridine synthase [Thermoanaerobaculia bacterium]|jgi:23S rRNA pseudouridine1911/1915/1917 synthase|nr:RluA family pseudouridine synthase [Thermoanaerobaculia bacterium]